MALDRAMVEAKSKEWAAQLEAAQKELAMLQARGNQVSLTICQLQGAVAGAQQLLAADKPDPAPPVAPDAAKP